MCIRDSQKGQAALFVTMVITSLIVFIGYFVTNIAIKQTKTVIDVTNSVQAFYNADLGVEAVLDEVSIFPYHILETDPTDTVNIDTSSGPVKIPVYGEDGIDEYDVFVDDNEAPSPELVIKVRGYYKNTMRSIQLSWSTF